MYYTDGQKKRITRILSGKTCGSQKQAARAYHRLSSALQQKSSEKVGIIGVKK